jgi:hypothetical protein
VRESWLAYRTIRIGRKLEPNVSVTTSLITATRRLLADPDEARARGLIARRAVLDRNSLPRLLHDWALAFKETAEITVRVP